MMRDLLPGDGTLFWGGIALVILAMHFGIPDRMPLGVAFGCALMITGAIRSLRPAAPEGKTTGKGDGT
jgi:hypothetical protein